MPKVFATVKAEINQHPLSELAKMYLADVQHSGQDFTATCPFCGADSGKFWLYNDTNKCYCFSCDHSGDIIDIAGAVNHLDFKSSVNDVAAKIHSDQHLVVREVQPKHVQRANKTITDLAYRILLMTFGLSDADRTYLKQVRHLDDSEIEKYGFFTMPTDNAENQRKLYNMTCRAGYTLNLYRNVPGFYLDNQKLPETMTNAIDRKGHHSHVVHLTQGEGIGIPIRNADGFIVGIQIRSRYKNAKVRYRWWTSGSHQKAFGASGTSYAQVFPELHSDEVALTEGFFKGHALNSFYHLNVIAVSGVRNVKDVVENINRLSVQRQAAGLSAIKRVSMYFDADLSNNLNVLDALNKLGDMIKTELGITAEIVLWQLSYGKGIDDLLNNVSSPLPLNAFRRMTITAFEQRSNQFKDMLVTNDFEIKNGRRSKVKLFSSKKFNSVFFA